MDKLVKSNRKRALLIGLGMALFPIHNQWLTDITSINGMATLFLPAFGTVIWVLATLFFLQDNWRGLDWGDKRVFVPLLVIVGAMGLSGITADTLGGKVAPLLTGVSLFALYLVSRTLGKDVFLPLAIGACIASLGVILHSLVFPGKVTGGFVFEKNYDIVVGYVLLGTALFVHDKQWMLAGLALVAMFLSGSPEAVFVVGVIGVTVFYRRDWGRRLLFALSPTVIIIGLWFGLGYGQNLCNYTWQVATGTPTTSAVVNDTGDRGYLWAVRYRIDVIEYSMTNLKPLGEGYILTDFSRVKNVHNVPLVIVQQLGWPGVLAGLAWLWVSVWCLVKTRWKYAWVAIMALSVCDHYIWTQLAPYWWTVIGASTVGGISTDLVFRRTR